MTRKEFLTIVFSFENFQPHLTSSYLIFHTNHASLKHLFFEKDIRHRLLRWIMLLQKFFCEIRDGEGFGNLIAYQLSWIIVGKKSDSCICECFINKQILIFQSEPWYTDIVNYVVLAEIPLGWSKHNKVNSFIRWKFSIRMNFTCSNIVLVYPKEWD